MELQRVEPNCATFTSLLQKSVLTHHRGSVTICWMNEWITKAKNKKAQTPLYSHLSTHTVIQDNGFRCRPLIFVPPNPCVPRCLVVSDSLWPHGLQPARLICPQDSTGKNTLEWVAISFCRGSSRPRDQTPISCTGRWIFLTTEPLGKLPNPWPQSISSISTPCIFTCFDPAPIQRCNLHWLFLAGTLSFPFCTHSKLWISAATLDTTSLVLYFYMTLSSPTKLTAWISSHMTHYSSFVLL